MAHLELEFCRANELEDHSPGEMENYTKINT